MKILHVISSPRGGASFSTQLGNAIIAKITKEHPGSSIKTKNLSDGQFPHLEESHLVSFHTPAQDRTPENLEAVKHSDNAIQEIMEADAIVISAPLYNFGVNSALKAWIDHISRAGVTFSYGENGPVGLVKNKKVYIAMASGGVYSEGAMQAYDHATPYLKAILGFLGMTDVTVFRVEGTAMPNVQDVALEKGIESIVL